MPKAAGPTATDWGDQALLHGEICLLGFCLALGALLQISTLRCMQADTAPFFLNILARHHFETWDFPRQFAHYITQGPLVLAIRLGLRHVPSLACLYGLGLFGVAVGCFALCGWIAAPQARRDLLPLGICLICLAILTSSFVISESSVASALFFVLFSLLALRLPYTMPTTGQWLVGALAALASLRAYEFFILFGPLLTVMAWMTLRHRWRELPPLGRAVLLWLGAAGLGAAGISGYYMFFSTRSVQSAHLSDILLRLGSSPAILAVLVVTAFTLLGGGHLWLPRTQPLRWATGVATAGAALGLLPVVYLPSLPSSGSAYDARVLHALLPLAWAALVGLGRLGRLRPDPRAWLLPLALVVGYSLGWQTAAGLQWQRYLQRLDDALLQHHGLVALQSTPLRDDPFVWSWCMPALSIVNSAVLRPQWPVEAIMLPRGNDPWTPFDFRHIDAYWQLQDYGITYAIRAEATRP